MSSSTENSGEQKLKGEKSPWLAVLANEMFPYF